MALAIEAEGLAKRFGSTQALAGVDLAAAAGTVLAILGPNGSGKTTTVRILATLLRPDAGWAATTSPPGPWRCARLAGRDHRGVPVPDRAAVPPAELTRRW